MTFYIGELSYNVLHYFSFHWDRIILSTLYEDIPVLLSARQEIFPNIHIGESFFRKKTYIDEWNIRFFRQPFYLRGIWKQNGRYVYVRIS